MDNNNVLFLHKIVQVKTISDKNIHSMECVIEEVLQYMKKLESISVGITHVQRKKQRPAATKKAYVPKQCELIV
jgi:tRNA(Ser,Leu) C12 N-acetylase TAN1